MAAPPSSSSPCSMKASPTATIPATQPCLGPKVCGWTSSQTGLPSHLAPSPQPTHLLFIFYFFLFCFQALGEVELRATLSSRPRYCSSISSPTQSTCLQDGVSPSGVNNRTWRCAHFCLFLLTGCGNPPFPPRHMPGLNPGQRGALSSPSCP